MILYIVFPDAESDEDEASEPLKDQLDLYFLFEVAWHLCEILFVETLPQGCLIQQLLEWVCVWL